MVNTHRQQTPRLLWHEYPPLTPGFPLLDLARWLVLPSTAAGATALVGLPTYPSSTKRDHIATVSRLSLPSSRHSKMGIVEGLLEHVSLTTILLLVPGVLVALVGYKLLTIAGENMKLARRGPRAPKVPSKVPFGG